MNKLVALIVILVLSTLCFAQDVRIVRRDNIGQLTRTVYQQTYNGLDVLNGIDIQVVDADGTQVVRYNHLKNINKIPLHPSPSVVGACYLAQDDDTIVPAQYISKNGYETIVSPEGNVLFSRSLRWDAAPPKEVPDQYFVFMGESPKPNYPAPWTPQDWEPEYIDQQFDVVGSRSIDLPMGWSYKGMTRGNTVATMSDTGQAFTLVPRVFNPLLDPDQYVPVTAVQAFHDINHFLEVMYKLGFNEVAGNFQNDNFGRGGKGGDRMTVYIGTGKERINNAAFQGDFRDGNPAYIWLLPFLQDVYRHSGLVRSVTYHEGTHGVHVRLNPILYRFTITPFIIGEADAYTISFVMNSIEGQNYAAPYGDGAYLARAFTKYAYFYGIRRYPFSTDMSINPTRLGFWNKDDVAHKPGYEPPPSDIDFLDPFEPHSLGEVWSAVQIDFYSKMTERYGYNKAKLRMLQLLVDAFKLRADTPDLLQAREAILLADKYRNNQEDRTIIWWGLARRGVGINAVTPDDQFYYPVIESFDVPNWADYDQNKIKNLEDWIAFSKDFKERNWRADINADNKLNIQDFIEFQLLWRGK